MMELFQGMAGDANVAPALFFAQEAPIFPHRMEFANV